MKEAFTIRCENLSVMQNQGAQKNKKVVAIFKIIYYNNITKY